MKPPGRAKLITCFLDKDSAPALADYLHNDCDLHSIHFAHARGQSSSNHTAHAWKERDIIQVVVSRERAKEIFEKIYLFQELDQRPNGFMFQEDLMMATPFIPPPQQSEDPQSD
jgi:hypothetical protein